MGTSKVAISINQNLLKKLDLLVKSKVFKSRSQAIQAAVQSANARCLVLCDTNGGRLRIL